MSGQRRKNWQGSGWINVRLRLAIYLRDGRQCLNCGSKHNLSLDHVLPDSLGGGDEVTNLVTMCMKCNIERSNKPVPENIAAIVEYQRLKDITPYLIMAKNMMKGKRSIAQVA